MKTNILAFGIVKDYFESASAKIELSDGATVGSLRNALESLYPALKELSCYMVAVNDEYAEDDLALNEKDEIAIIPPVSGG
ncbi:MAG: molybdopterin converting factor subunit 1 [Agriterribacter sp.]